MRKAFFPIVAMLLMLVLGTHAHAQNAHVHGTAELQVAIDGNMLQLALITPLDNVIGFEHAPRNKEQRQAVQAMVEKFRKPELLFVPTAAARCVPDPVRITSSVTDTKVPTKGQKEDSDHAGLEAVVTFRCASASVLKDIEVKLFEAFPGMRRLNVQLVGPRGQVVASLSARQPRLFW